MIETVRKCIQEAVFSKENLVDYLNTIGHPNSESGFDSVMNTLSSTVSGEEQFDGIIPETVQFLIIDVTTLPLLLKIALEALKQAPQSITADQKSILGATFLSTLDSLSFPPPAPNSHDVQSVVSLSIRHLQKLCDLLQTFSENAPPDSDTLSATLTTISTTCLPFLDFNDRSVAIWGWKALALMMKIDFDIVLGIMVQISPRIHTATLEFLSILVITKFNIRNGVEFVKEWTEHLANTDDEKTSLRDSDLTRL